jgi:hypothetical protein
VRCVSDTDVGLVIGRTASRCGDQERGVYTCKSGAVEFGATRI